LIVHGQRPNLKIYREQDQIEDDDLDFDDAQSDSSIETNDTDIDSQSFSSEPLTLSEKQDLLHGITKSIDSLFKTVAILRKFRMEKRQSFPFESNTSAHDPECAVFISGIDVLRMHDCYPVLSRKNPNLASRLGIANARRRQMFKDSRDAQDKNGSSLPVQGEHFPQLDSVNSTLPTTEILTSAERSSNIETEALSGSRGESSILVIPTFEPNLSDLSFARKTAASAPSVITITTSVADTNGDTLEGLEIPVDGRDGAPFQCPYCFVIQRMRTEHQWQ
jgi:hypothetical protein